MTPRTLVFLPAWNEEGAIASTLAGLHSEFAAELSAGALEFLVCDDGSVDETAHIARVHGATVASIPFHVGIGGAVHAGYIYARRQGFDFAAHCDADGQHPPRELRRLLERAWEGDVDLLIGSRYLSRKGDGGSSGESGLYKATLSRTIGIALFRALLSWQTGIRFTDTTSGFRVASRRAIELYAERYASDYPELEALQRVVERRLTVREMQVDVLPRVAGRSKITPFRSAHFVWKSAFTVLLGLLPPHTCGGGSQ